MTFNICFIEHHVMHFLWVSEPMDLMHVNKLHRVDCNCELWIVYPHSFGLGDLGTIFAELILGNINSKRKISI